MRISLSSGLSVIFSTAGSVTLATENDWVNRKACFETQTHLRNIDYAVMKSFTSFPKQPNFRIFFVMPLLHLGYSSQVPGRFKNMLAWGIDLENHQSNGDSAYQITTSNVLLRMHFNVEQRLRSKAGRTVSNVSGAVKKAKELAPSDGAARWYFLPYPSTSPFAHLFFTVQMLCLIK